MLKNFNSFVTFSPLCNTLDHYKFQVHAEELECVTIFSHSIIFLNQMESFSNLMKIPVYDKAVNFLQTGLYMSIVWHLILGFILWVKHFYLIKTLHNSE